MLRGEAWAIGRRARESLLYREVISIASCRGQDEARGWIVAFSGALGLSLASLRRCVFDLAPVGFFATRLPLTGS
jgi:hypothetical protein